MQCRTEKGIDPYSVQYGLDRSHQTIHLHEVKLDSAQFADGKYRYFLYGQFTNTQQQGDFMVCTEGVPGEKGMQILSHHFSFGTEESKEYDCTVYPAEQAKVIEWRKETKVLRIVLPPTSAH